MNRTALLLAATIWVGYVVLLQVVPRLAPPDPGLPNAAAQLGYNIVLAYWVIVAWTLVALGLVWALCRDAPPGAAAAGTVPLGIARGRAWLERALVAGAVAAIYWPPAIARFGPHVEDAYFLTALWRMACGAAPYADFEYLYGPLTIYPSFWLHQLAGFSATGFYAVYTILQVALFVGLVAALQHYLPRFRDRLIAFALIVPFLTDILLGLNFIAWRYAAAVAVILILAARPDRMAAALIAGACAGIGAAYSYEYGIAALLSGVAITLALLFQPGRGAALGRAGAFVATALAVFWVTGFAATGADFGTWLTATRHAAATASALGLGQFALIWTGHSLALFAILAVAAVTGGLALRRLGRVSATEGDLHLIGAAAFAIVALRIALQRVDHFHLAIPFVPLMLVLLLNRPRALLAAPAALRAVALAAMTVAAAAHLFGHVPLGQWVLQSNLRGLVHEVTGRPTAGPDASPAGRPEAERFAARPEIVALAARLKADDLSDRPVLFYGSLWTRAAATGVCPVGYSFYDLLYSDDRVPLKDTLDARPDALVVIDADILQRLEDGLGAPVSSRPLSGLQSRAARASSVHFRQTLLENGVEYEMWKARLGDWLVSRYVVFDQVGRHVILERTP